MFRASEVVKSHEPGDADDDAPEENFPGKNAIADIPSDYARHVIDSARQVWEGGYSFREGDLGLLTVFVPLAVVVGPRD